MLSLALHLSLHHHCLTFLLSLLNLLLLHLCSELHIFDFLLCQSSWVLTSHHLLHKSLLLHLLLLLQLQLLLLLKLLLLLLLSLLLNYLLLCSCSELFITLLSSLTLSCLHLFFWYFNTIHLHKKGEHKLFALSCLDIQFLDYFKFSLWECFSSFLNSIKLVRIRGTNSKK